MGQTKEVQYARSKRNKSALSLSTNCMDGSLSARARLDMLHLIV